MTNPVDDIMDDISDRHEMAELVRTCESAVLLFYDDESRPCVKRLNISYSAEAYLYVAANARFSRTLMDDNGEDDDE